MNKDKLLYTFYVNPQIPEKLQKLNELSYNLWSTWDKQAIRLFNRIDPIIYRQCQHNPVMLLHRISQERLGELAEDSGFLAELDIVYKNYIDYLAFKGHYLNNDGGKDCFSPDDHVAYFSMEYSLHESLPIYSGGLGVLSGDHLKAASDLAIPLSGFGLLYKYGYFSQFINLNGEQQEKWQENRWHLMPITILKDEKNVNRLFSIKILSEEIWLRAWVINIGKVKLYLLDTNIPENSPENRSITDRLYDADRRIRLLQELVLSFGSLKLIELLKIQPTVYHLNEGHSAFIILERLQQLLNGGYSFNEASQLVANSTVFTTHTPVTAGNEHFDRTLIEQYLSDRIKALGLNPDRFFELASIDGDKQNYWLPALALRFSKHTNAVSKLHSTISKRLWESVYPQLIVDEIPISYVTNGVHTQTWLSKELTLLFDRYIGIDYLHSGENSSAWQNIIKIPEIEVWEAHQRRKEQMISFIRQRIENSLLENNAAAQLSRKLRNTLSPDILTIGFARRFAPYKRSNLILTDPERLLSLINNSTRPIQFVFAGKAHPADPEGKKLIKNLIDFAKFHDIEDRFVFVENYDLNVAKHLVQGVDVWLNTPIRPMEASGTSGMKAGLNGVLNLSVLDGWWPECYDGDNGWSIKDNEFYDSQDVNNHLEAHQIYDLLEGEISELYYRRDESNLPVGWIQKMKHSIYTVGMNFNLHRMLREYINGFYLEGIKAYKELKENDDQLLHEILGKHDSIAKSWQKVYLKNFSLKHNEVEILSNSATQLMKGDILQAECYVYLDNSHEDFYTLEIFCLNQQTNDYEIVTLPFKERYKDNVALYSGDVKLSSSGLQGMNVRLKADNHPYLREYYNYFKWK